MNKPNFLIAGMIAAGCIFTSCTDRTVATTDQYPADGTATTTTTGDTETTDTGTTDTGIAEAETDEYDQQGMTRDDVSATGEGVDMDRMAAGADAEAILVELPAPTRELVEPMLDMMQQLRMHETTGNIDQDFARMMATHHQGAINMANQVLQSGDNQEIISRARQMITTKQQEIDQLQQYAGDQTGMTGDQTGMTGTTTQQGTGTEQGDPAQQLRAATEGTLQQLQQEELNGDADHDFAHIMILHHEDAIEMAQVQLEHGQDAELKTLAQQIIDKNQREISELESWAVSNSR